MIHSFDRSPDYIAPIQASLNESVPPGIRGGARINIGTSATGDAPSVCRFMRFRSTTSPPVRMSWRGSTRSREIAAPSARAGSNDRVILIQVRIRGVGYGGWRYTRRREDVEKPWSDAGYQSTGLSYASTHGAS